MKVGTKIQYIESSGRFRDLYDGEVLEVVQIIGGAFSAASGNRTTYLFSLDDENNTFCILLEPQPEISPFTPTRRDFYIAKSIDTAREIWFRTPISQQLGRHEIAEIAVMLADSIIARLDERSA